MGKYPLIIKTNPSFFLGGTFNLLVKGLIKVNPMSASDVGEMHLETSATNKFYMESMVPNPKAS